jgi:hypothetical protein
MLNELDSIGNEKGFDDNSSVVEFLVKYYKNKGEI